MKMNAARRWLMLAAALIVAATGAVQGIGMCCLVHARSLIQTNLLDDSAGWLDFAEIILPGSNAETEFLRARIARKREQMGEFRRHLQQALDGGYPAELAQREQWLALAQQGQLNRVEQHLSSLLTDPRSDAAEICSAYVTGYLRLFRFPEALGLLGAWEKDFPESPEPPFLRGRISEYQGDLKEAIAAYERAVELAPAQRDIRRRLVAMLIKSRLTQQAAAHLQVLVSTGDSELETLEALAECRWQEGNLEAAGTIWNQMLQFDPENLRAKTGLTEYDLNQRRFAEALARARSLHLELPEDYSVRYLLARALQASGETRAASVLFDEVQLAERELAAVSEWIEKAQGDPDDLDLRLKIGLTLVKHGQFSEAAGWLRSVVDRSSGRSDAQNALAKCYTRLGLTEPVELDRETTLDQGREP